MNCEWTPCPHDAVGQAHDPLAKVWFLVCAEHLDEADAAGLDILKWLPLWEDPEEPNVDKEFWT